MTRTLEGKAFSKLQHGLLGRYEDHMGRTKKIISETYPGIAFGGCGHVCRVLAAFIQSN
jgi:hypothetical protein